MDLLVTRIQTVLMPIATKLPGKINGINRVVLFLKQHILHLDEQFSFYLSLLYILYKTQPFDHDYDMI